jgi:hypothetical protein
MGMCGHIICNLNHLNRGENMDRRVLDEAVEAGLAVKSVSQSVESGVVFVVPNNGAEHVLVIGTPLELPGLVINLVCWVGFNHGKYVAEDLLGARISQVSVSAPIKVFVCLDRVDAKTMTDYPYTLFDWLVANQIQPEHYMNRF